MYPWPWTVDGRAERVAKMAEDRTNFMVVFLFLLSVSVVLKYISVSV